MPFTGVSAFPLTPFVDDRVDENAYAAFIRRIALDPEANSITALGSTGSYAYLSRAERALVSRVAVENSGTTPVFVGIGSTRTRHVIEHAADAADAGAEGLLLAPVSYQPLSDEEVYGLFRDVASSTDLPIVVYDNPRTTAGYAFTPAMYARVAELRGVSSIKIPGRSGGPAAARAHVDRIRAGRARDRLDLCVGRCLRDSRKGRGVRWVALGSRGHATRSRAPGVGDRR